MPFHDFPEGDDGFVFLKSEELGSANRVVGDGGPRLLLDQIARRNP
jgi:hypothetical protein